jgi:carbonic anhydrase
MKPLLEMLAYNRRWAAEQVARDPGYFARHVAGQAPSTLQIGCSDSRVPLTEITGVDPGEMFVHRNIANQAHSADLNVQSVIAYAVDVLQVGHIMVTGHTGCGGVKAATQPPDHGMVDHWLGGIRALWRSREAELAALPSDEARLDRLVELNVVRQVSTLALNPTVQDAWRDGRPLVLHGLVYQLETGHLRAVVSGIDDLEAMRRYLDRSGPA